MLHYLNRNEVTEKKDFCYGISECSVASGIFKMNEKEADIKAFIAARKGAVERFMKEYWEK